MICTQCGTEYQAQRSTSKYCSGACRKAAHDVSVTVSVTHDQAPVTLSLHEINCQARGINTCNTGQWLPIDQLDQHHVNRVAIPGDADYVGVWQCG